MGGHEPWRFAPAMPDVSLRVQLLGRPRASWHGRQVRLASRNAWALLALIALRPRPRPRESIAADLWPDATATSTTALRQALWLLRSGLADAGADPEAILAVDDETVGLRADCPLDLDSVRFERLANRRPPRCEEAVALYRGELAEGLAQECFERERERFADLFEDALAEVALALLARNELDAARLVAHRLIGLDPLREEAHAVLIEVYGRSGSRSQVSRQYRRLQSVLREELGVDPLPETDAIYWAAMDRLLTSSARRRAAGVRAPAPMLAATFDS